MSPRLSLSRALVAIAAVSALLMASGCAALGVGGAVHAKPKPKPTVEICDPIAVGTLPPSKFEKLALKHSALGNFATAAKSMERAGDIYLDKKGEVTGRCDKGVQQALAERALLAASEYHLLNGEADASAEVFARIADTIERRGEPLGRDVALLMTLHKIRLGLPNGMGWPVDKQIVRQLGIEVPPTRPTPRQGEHKVVRRHQDTKELR